VWGSTICNFNNNLLGLWVIELLSGTGSFIAELLIIVGVFNSNFFVGFFFII